MRLVAAQAFRCGQLAPEAAEAHQYLIRTRQAKHSHLAPILHQIDLIAFLQSEFANKFRRQADGK